MPSIFGYTDFRQYLKDCYRDIKKLRPGFSYKAFAKLAGFKDKSNIYSVVSGYRNLARHNIARLAQALKLRRSEADFFDALVGFNQAKGLPERQFHYQRLNEIHSTGKAAAEARLVREDQYEFYSKWYHCAIRSILDMYEFKNDWPWLARMVSPAITPGQAKKSVELQQKLGLVKQRRNGVWEVTHKVISTGDEVTGLAVQTFHIEAAQLAQRALSELPRSKRYITGLTLGISEKSYREICNRTNAYHDEILAIAEKDPDADRVYQFNFHLFPLSKT